MNPQLEYDNQLPPETEPELDIEDALDNLYDERYDKYILEFAEKCIELIKEDLEWEVRCIKDRKRDRDNFSSYSTQYAYCNKEARNHRSNFHNILDGLVKLLKQKDKEKLLEFYKELI